MVARRKQPPLLNLVEELLAEQSRLQTPVARASIAHDQLSSLRSQISNYQSLIPLSTPGPGEQYAFEVDLDACSGCKACVVACHSLNGLDDGEAWRDVGLVAGGSGAAPYQQTITTACHHCADPACLNGCPVLAYEKAPLTGIVRHLDDQCIGCQYCILKCPYDVPKYNERLGIVRKCDLCHQRLAVGEAPACAQACPTHAIKIVTVTVSPIANLKSEISNPDFLPSAPDPSYTQPTTRYVTQRPVPANTRAADATLLRPQPAHWPLVILLTLLPFAICLQTVLLTPLAAGAPALLRWLPLALGATGLGAATLHLGQPLRAWRVFLGLRRSWFSREAVLFGAWFGLTGAAALLPFVLPRPGLTDSLALAAAVTGLLGLGCSVMIYVDTRRQFWRLSHTAPRLLGTGLVLALATVAPVTAALVLFAKLVIESLSLPGASTSARLLRGPLRRATILRYTLGLLAFLALLARSTPEHVTYYVTVAGLLAGEGVERSLFFRAVDAPKMPGQPDPRRPGHP
ncbi:Anaerobic dimethyl sulfoxide reductase chain B [Lacunisphaera limnophila]|uniref:Anaerobic dimethyl sulfoxide reductase chain B n=1 Tax=Lacunisphaera limnophila TaxID=1838286 RepID=A0A1D8AZ90_9BACT|nr:DmsC/YnfH family molybdoenzyme membrane anchor subunit [Lacunisphaera limnophila]AOS46174.1 Anaerobic dimethyl sulfoxide reductase chain B [Lacunisphaera limnophila]